MWPVVSDAKDNSEPPKAPKVSSSRERRELQTQSVFGLQTEEKARTWGYLHLSFLLIYCQLEDSDKRDRKMTINIVGVKTILVPSWALLSHDFPTKKLCIGSSYHLLSGHRKSSTLKASSYQAISTALWMDSIVLWYRKSKTIGTLISDTAFNITEELEGKPNLCSKGAPLSPQWHRLLFSLKIKIRTGGQRIPSTMGRTMN